MQCNRLPLLRLRKQHQEERLNIAVNYYLLTIFILKYIFLSFYLDICNSILIV